MTENINWETKKDQNNGLMVLAPKRTHHLIGNKLTWAKEVIVTFDLQTVLKYISEFLPYLTLMNLKISPEYNRFAIQHRL